MKIPSLDYLPSSYWLWFGGLYMIGYSLNAPINQGIRSPLFWSYLLFFFFGVYFLQQSADLLLRGAAIAMTLLLLVGDPVLLHRFLLVVYVVSITLQRQNTKNQLVKLIQLLIQPMAYLVPLFVGLEPKLSSLIPSLSLYPLSLATYLLAALANKHYLTSSS